MNKLKNKVNKTSGKLSHKISYFETSNWSQILRIKIEFYHIVTVVRIDPLINYQKK
jgi:hypothetical protein